MQIKLNIKLKNTKDLGVKLNQDEFIRRGLKFNEFQSSTLKFADFGGRLSPSALYYVLCTHPTGSWWSRCLGG